MIFVLGSFRVKQFILSQANNLMKKWNEYGFLKFPRTLNKVLEKIYHGYKD